MVRWRARCVIGSIGCWMELTLCRGQETARLDGTAAGDGTAEFRCRKHDAGLRMKELMAVDEVQWMKGERMQNGRQLMGSAGSRRKARSKLRGEIID